MGDGGGGGTKVFTSEELSQFDGRQADGRIYMALNGLVYDVTSGGKFYGSGQSRDPLRHCNVTECLIITK